MILKLIKKIKINSFWLIGSCLLCTYHVNAETISAKKELSCPQTSLSLIKVNQDQYPDMSKHPPQNYFAICGYDNGALLYTFWSENKELGAQICQSSPIKEIIEKGMYHIVDHSPEHYQGIGASAKKLKDYIEVVLVHENSPAKRAGLKIKDIIKEVDGVSTQDLSINDMVELLRGEKDTSVGLKIYRPSDKSYLDLNLVRGFIEPDYGHIEIFSPTHLIKAEGIFPYNNHDPNYWTDHLKAMMMQVTDLAISCHSQNSK